MPQTKNFKVHHRPGAPPWVTPDGGNGWFSGEETVELSWKSDGSTGRFTLRCHESSCGPAIPWPFDSPEPSWPVSECKVTKNPDGHGYKYSVVIEGHESDPLDPMLVFDRVQRRSPGPNVYIVATVAAVIGFVIGWVVS